MNDNDSDLPPEFSRSVDPDRLPRTPQHYNATESECLALAARFDLARLDRLEATLTFTARGKQIALQGDLRAALAQYCALSRVPVPVLVQEDVHIVLDPDVTDDDVEDLEALAAEEGEHIPWDGGVFDAGEMIAQSLMLALDPYIQSDDATVVAAARARLLTEEAAKSTAANPFDLLKMPQKPD